MLTSESPKQGEECIFPSRQPGTGTRGTQQVTGSGQGGWRQDSGDIKKGSPSKGSNDSGSKYVKGKENQVLHYQEKRNRNKGKMKAMELDCS